MRKAIRVATRLLAVLVIVGVLAASWALWMVRGSLPVIEGELALPGLSAPVTVSRDALGIATIEAANEADAARALGFVHAQERYFEMDLLRRSAAGELSALFGPIAIERDSEIREADYVVGAQLSGLQYMGGGEAVAPEQLQQVAGCHRWAGADQRLQVAGRVQADAVVGDVGQGRGWQFGSFGCAVHGRCPGARGGTRLGYSPDRQVSQGVA